ncbi:4-oxalocrotonate tautomerase family protein [uncultured Roseibium sp.]|uniref:tautomerase family protein n=1 Tax=uncultured Roseibium sp. TaxID=1936171 RepID=UPI00260EC687|nr:4-oxalocrotonate tautomerase family protein [uncultured Roseibium sp.]
MPFANYKLPQDSLTNAQKEDLIHKTTELMVGLFGEAVRPTTMVLVEEIKDGGYGRADEVFVMPDDYRVRE